MAYIYEMAKWVETFYWKGDSLERDFRYICTQHINFS